MALTKEQLENAVEMVVYVVVEGSYEYNDEYNYESDGSYPNVVFLDEAQAEAFAKQQSREWAAGQDPDNWYDGEIPDNLYSVMKIPLRGLT